MGVFGASILVGGLTACSGGHYHHQRHGAMTPERMAEMRGKMAERISSKLDLDATQKQKLTALADTLQAQRSAFVGPTDPRTEMQAIVAGDRFDRSRAEALLGEKTRALQTQGPEVIAAMADFYDSLHPAQQQKVRELMQRRKGWMARG